MRSLEKKAHFAGTVQRDPGLLFFSSVAETKANRPEPFFISKGNSEQVHRKIENERPYSAAQAVRRIEEATRGPQTDVEGVFNAIRGCCALKELAHISHIRRILNRELSEINLARARLLLRYGNEKIFPPYITALWNIIVPDLRDKERLFTLLNSLFSTELSELQMTPEFVKLIRDRVSGRDSQRLHSILARGELTIFEPDSYNEDHPANAVYVASSVSSPLAVVGEGDTEAFSPNDVYQGPLGSCSFLATIISLAIENPAIIRNMISPQLPDGSYNVTFQVRTGNTFTPRLVNVTPVFPVRFNSLAAVNLYTQVADQNASTYGEIWVPLLEKAYAILRGSYRAIHGLNPVIPMENVTGQRSTNLMFENNTDAQLIPYITSELEANHPVVAGTKTREEFHELSPAEVTFATEHQIIGDHAYALFSISNEQVGLRNPWGGERAVQMLTLPQFRTYFFMVSTYYPTR